MLRLTDGFMPLGERVPQAAKRAAPPDRHGLHQFKGSGFRQLGFGGIARMRLGSPACLLSFGGWVLRFRVWEVGEWVSAMQRGHTTDRFSVSVLVFGV